MASTPTPPLLDPLATPAPVAPRRLFTALFPGAAASAAIDAERHRWAGRPPRLHPVRERMHLTLQFFNAVDAPHARAWQAALSDLRFDSFDVVLTHAELWRLPSGTIAVLRPAPSEALEALSQATARLAQQAGLSADPQRWQPHVTTLRRAERCQLPATLAAPIRWTVRQVDLIWSDLQAQPPRYVRLGRYPLPPGQAGRGRAGAP